MYLQIPGFPGYEVDEHGSVRSWRKPGRFAKGEATKPKALQPDVRDGIPERLSYVLRAHNRSHRRTIEWLILAAHDRLPEDGEIPYNSKPGEVHSSNLRWILAQATPLSELSPDLTIPPNWRIINDRLQSLSGLNIRLRKAERGWRAVAFKGDKELSSSHPFYNKGWKDRLAQWLSKWMIESAEWNP